MLLNNLTELVAQNTLHSQSTAHDIIQYVIDAGCIILTKDDLLNPDMPDQEMRLHMGELTANEILVARAALRWQKEKTIKKATERGDLNEGYQEKAKAN